MSACSMMFVGRKYCWACRPGLAKGYLIVSLRRRLSQTVDGMSELWRVAEYLQKLSIEGTEDVSSLDRAICSILFQESSVDGR